MSFRSWVYVFTVIGLAFASLGQAQQQAEAPNNRAENQEQNSQPWGIPVIIVESEESSNSRQSSEEEGRQREIADLFAQQGMNESTQTIKDATLDMRDYALYSTIAVCVGTFLLILTLCISHQANKAAIKAVAITDRVGRYQTSSWMGFIEVPPAFVVDRNDPSKCRYVFTLKNFGTTPGFILTTDAGQGVATYEGLPLNPGGTIELFSHETNLEKGREVSASVTYRDINMQIWRLDHKVRFEFHDIGPNPDWSISPVSEGCRLEKCKQ